MNGATLISPLDNPGHVKSEPNMTLQTLTSLARRMNSKEVQFTNTASSQTGEPFFAKHFLVALPKRDVSQKCQTHKGIHIVPSLQSEWRISKVRWLFIDLASI